MSENCGYCDQPQGKMYEPNAQYHECIECGKQIDPITCDNNQGLCNDCAIPTGKMD